MEVKLFTFDGIVVTVIHDFILIGLAACWVFINVQVLGNDVEVGRNRWSESSPKHR